MRLYAAVRVPFAALLLCFALQCLPLPAQSGSAMSVTQFNLVMPHGDGRLVVPSNPNWTVTSFGIDEDTAGTVFKFRDERHELDMEAVVFPNDDGTAEACRDLALSTLLSRLRNQGEIEYERQGLRFAPNGAPFATETFLIKTTDLNPGDQQNVYAFAAGAHTCAEIHMRKSSYVAADTPFIEGELNRFRFDARYTPTSHDFEVLANSFFETMRDFRSAALYYRRALETLPFNATTLQQRRSLTDQLTMSYAVYGDYKNAYNVAEGAITLDPDYPFYYYNLACVDAELHNPLDARRHLQQAFDRRRNADPEEPLPDPTQDTSLQKLQRDRIFWDFVKKLSAQTQ